MAREILLVPQKAFLGGKLFHMEKSNRGYETSKPALELREHLGKLGFELKTIDQSGNIPGAEAIVFFEMPDEKNPYYKFCLENRLQERMYLIANEPHTVHPPNHDPSLHGNFKRILTWNEDLVDNKKYLKLDYMIPIKAGEKIKLKRTPFSEKKLLCLISSNKFSTYEKELYSERIRAVRFMERNHPEEFDLYGIGWDLPIVHSKFANDFRINAAIQKFWPKLPKFLRVKSYPSYRGKVDFKSELFPRYKFTIAYENELDGNGYITEKILESFLYGCVPVYLGDKNIGKRIPKECFVEKREYGTYEELYERLSSMKEKEHAQYLDNIEKFLNSKAVYPFTMDAYIENFKRLVGIG